MTNTSQFPGSPLLVHKTGAEGAIEIDDITGQIRSDKSTLPEWAEGLYACSFAERNGWYAKRLGGNVPDSIKTPDVLVFQDLHWVGISDDGVEIELAADNEYRMDKLAETLNIDLSDVEMKDIDGAITHALEVHNQFAEPTDEVTLREAEDAAQSGNVEQIGNNQQKAVGE